VPNWSISRNYMSIWNSTKYSVTTQMFVTRRPRGAKPQVQEAQGPTGWPSPMAGWPHFELGLGSYIHTSVQKRILCPRVGGNREEWSAGHVDGRPADYHIQFNLIKLVEDPLYPYIRIPTVEFTQTTLFL
jgi:hypothetical protein